MTARFSTLQEAYGWLDGQINHERRLDRIESGEDAFHLEAIRAALERLGQPQRAAPAVHIAGTRGKGSSALMLEALLRASGLRVATFTSPHLREYRERIRIDGRPVDPALFLGALGLAADARCNFDAESSSASIRTVFEFLTAAFFLAAREAGVDWMIVETGLGGRLDSTNVLPAGPVLLTRIGLDHTRILGSTAAAIAAEKAAILKPGGWGVYARQAPGGEAESVFEARAAGTGAPLEPASVLCPLISVDCDEIGLNLVYRFEGEELPIRLNLLGPHLADNLQGALGVFARLRAEGRIPVASFGTIHEALKRVELSGRLEAVPLDPARGVSLIVDPAHCPTSARAVAQAMAAHFPGRPATALVGMMADKDHGAFFEALAGWPGWRRLVVYPPEVPRAASPERLARAAEPFFHQIITCGNPTAALETALAHAEENSRVVGSGSVYGLAPLLDWSDRHGRQQPDRLASPTQAEPQPGSGHSGAKPQPL